MKAITSIHGTDFRSTQLASSVSDWLIAPFRVSSMFGRILEMQVMICELVGKFSFALPEDDVIRTRLANTLLPTVRSGAKAAPLRITRVPQTAGS